jgi:hypothetical protein
MEVRFIRQLLAGQFKITAEKGGFAPSMGFILWTFPALDPS